jgi:DNA topoisomerase I
MVWAEAAESGLQCYQRCLAPKVGDSQGLLAPIWWNYALPMPPRLRRVDCSTPGFTRRRAGRGFVYLDHDGERIDDEATLTRIRELAIPPAWKDVWICPDERGHLQATGVDDAGRKQYRYHDRWRARRDAQKFEDMLEFAGALPRMRKRIARDLRGDGMSQKRVMACAARLLDLGFFRVGGETYAEENESFGLATIRRAHVTVDGDTVVFDYPAKSGQRRIQSIADPEVLDVVKQLKRRRSSEPDLLAYKEGRRWVDVRSEDINAYVKDVSGDEAFSAKDFRTWNATVLAAIAIADLGSEAKTKGARKRAASAAVKHVAGYLGNTPTVARNSYIDPRVFDRFDSGWTIGGVVGDVGDADLGEPLVRARIEEAVIDLIEESKSDALEKVA